MLRRCLAGVLAMLFVVGIVMAEEFRGSITKFEDGSITVKQGFVFGKDKKAEEKTFKVGDDVKVTRQPSTKDGEPVKLTLSELKTAIKVASINVTVVHEDGKVTEIKTGGGGGFGFKDKGKKKDDKKDKTDN